MLHEVMLYYPLRDEVKEDQVETLFEEKHGEERKVNIVKMQVMEFLEDIQEARYMVDQLKRDLELDLMKEAGKMLDPAGELDNEENQENSSRLLRMIYKVKLFRHICPHYLSKHELHDNTKQ